MNNSNSKISVIVPIYNVEKFLPKCIESILNQTFADFELILVNDGSLDNCLEICKQYKKIDKRILIIDKDNGGLVSARKSGLKKANAEFVAFVDGDDWVDKNYLKSMYILATANKVDLVITGHIREFEGKYEKIIPYNAAGVYCSSNFDKIIQKMIYTGIFCKHGITTYVWNKLFKKSILENILFKVPDEIVMGEDAAITYSYLSLSNSLAISSCCFYYYRQRTNSIVKTIQSIDSELKQLSKLFNFLYKNLCRAFELDKLKKDLSIYLYSQILVRTGGFFKFQENDKSLIPFNKLRSDDRTLVYSSGSFGQRLIKFNELQKNFKMKKWIDLDYEESRAINLNVESIYNISDEDCDSIIIASINMNYTKLVAKELNLLGINIKKIRNIKTGHNFIKKYLKAVGFNDEFIFNSK